MAFLPLPARSAHLWARALLPGAALALLALALSAAPAHAAGLALPPPDTAPAPPPTPARYGPPDALLLLDGSAPLEEALDAIEEEGGKALHSVLPHAVLAALPPGAEAALRGRAGIVEVTRGAVDAAALRARFGPAAGAAAAAWNGRVRDEFALGAEAGGAGAPLANDALEPPAPPRGWADGVGAANAGPGAPGYWETSSFLIGRVAVGVVLPESSAGGANSENWASPDPALPGQARPEVVLAEIMAAMESWAASEPRAGLEFVYDFHPGVPVSVEPVALRSSDQHLWIAPAMDTLGYAWVPDMFEKVRQFDNDLRTQHAADWAFTVFVVDSLNDADGMLADGRFGYAYLGGPFAVLTYDNDGWGIGQMNSVAAHEMAHLFHALDEYEGAQSACNARAGYLDAENQNSQYHPDGAACASDVPCVMRGGADGRTACAHTRAQLGWRDTDGDNVLDPLDTTVTLAVAPWPPDVSADATPTYAGSVTETPFPSARLTAVTINTVERIEVQVDGGAWAAVSAADGELGDEPVEEFSVTLGPLAEGAHTVVLRARNSAGVASDAVADTLTVDTTPPSAAIATAARYAGAEFADFWVEWTADDALAGVEEVAVDARDGNGAWQPFQRAPGSGRALFVGQDGHSYTFRARARDRAGNAGAEAFAARTVSVCPVAADAGDVANNGAGDNVQQDARWVQTDGAAHARTIHRAGDADWVKFQTAAGVAYTVVTENAGGAADTLLDVLLPGGATLENDDDPLGGPGSRVVWTAEADGVAYARVRHADAHAYGCAANYRLRVQAGDGVAPGAALTLAGGAAWVAASSVDAKLDAWDPGAGNSGSDATEIWRMRTSVDGNLAAAAWQTYAGQFSVALPAGEGTRTIYAQVMDQSGRVSAAVSDTVSVDVTPPTARVGPPVAQPGAIALAWSGEDALSGVEDFDVEVRDGEAGAWAPWRTRTHESGGTLDAQAEHTYWLRVRSRDRAGNVGGWAVSAPAQAAAAAAAPNVYLPLVGRGK